MSKSDERGSAADESIDAEHLEDVTDGCGCVEMWESLSEYRQRSD